MSNKAFPPGLVAKLNANPNVKSATKKSIRFSEKFKVFAVDDYLAGKPTRKIFEEAGFDVDALGSERIRNALNNWLTKYRKGKQVTSDATDRHAKHPPAEAERIARLEAENELLRQENEFLRQIRRLERRHQPSKSPSEKDSN